MAGIRYDIKPNQPDSHQSTPWACIRFYSFVGKDSIYQSGAPVSRDSAIKVKGTTVVSDILKLQVTHTKNSFMSQAEVVLSAGDINYQSLLTPGDHALIWMGSDQGTFETISNKTLNDAPSNDFNSGFKFMGRVNSVRSMYVTQAGGIKTLRYMVTFKGFSEFGTSVYYNPLLAPNSPDNQGNSQIQKASLVYSQISKNWNDYFFSKDQNKANVQSLVDFFIDIFLGKGPRDEAKKLEKAVRSPNGAFLMPREILRILGTEEPSSVPNYANVLQTIMGIQRYSNPKSFMPDININGSNSVQKITNKKLYGTVTAPPDMFNNTQLWSMIQQVSNPAINETYTTMRVNSNNKIVPTFVARQIPFTSIYALNSTQNLKTQDSTGTRFVDLPRWVIDPAMQIGTFNIGTTDAARFNFFQIYGTLFGINSSLPGFSQFAQIKKGNFQIDDIDISRHGSRNFITTSLVDFTENAQLTNSIAMFADLIRDWYGNGHLKLNGSITCAGIQEPICVGDNLQITNKLLHIESVTHMYEVSDSGNGGAATKSFVTSIDLSQGVLADGRYAFEEPTLRENLNTDGEGLEPGYSDAERYVNETPIVAIPTNSDKAKK